MVENFLIQFFRNISLMISGSYLRYILYNWKKRQLHFMKKYQQNFKRCKSCSCWFLGTWDNRKEVTIEFQFGCFYLCLLRWCSYKGLSVFRRPSSPFLFTKRVAFRFRIGARAMRLLKWVYIVVVTTWARGVQWRISKDPLLLM